MVAIYNNTTSGTEDSTWYDWNTTRTATAFVPSGNSLMRRVDAEVPDEDKKKPRVPYYEPFREPARPPERCKPPKPVAEPIRPHMLARSRC